MASLPVIRAVCSVPFGLSATAVGVMEDSPR
jgi:hypothetical protein